MDASLAFFKEAERRNADLLVVHHGLSWTDSLKYITGRNYDLVSFLVQRRMALYACHLPLDLHAKYGNNALICRALGLKRIKKFGIYGDRSIGFMGRFDKPMRYELFKKLVMKTVGPDLRTMDFGKKTIQSVAVVSGGGADVIAEAGRKGIDVFLSGEPKLMAYQLAREYGVNGVFAGHYATEVFGVRGLGDLLRKTFKVKAEFVDMAVPF